MERITIDFSYKIEEQQKEKTAFVYFENLTIEDPTQALNIAAALINKTTGEELDGIARLENKEDIEHASSENLQKSESDNLPEPQTENENKPKFVRGNKVAYKGGEAPKNETETIKCSPMEYTYVWAIFDINGWKYIIEHPQGFTKDVYIDQAPKQELKDILNQKLQDKKYIMVPEEDLLPA